MKKCTPPVFSCREARNMELVEYLETLGFKPEKIRNNDYWYRSPLREEKTPSFKVNRKLNAWYDHGLGKGGTIIDFGVLYHQCSIALFLQRLQAGFSFHQPSSKIDLVNQETYSSLRIVNASDISSNSLKHYLSQRCIPLDIFTRHCKQVDYELNGKMFTAIGFQNRAGSYELRSQYFKGSSAPKDISFIDNGSKEVSVLEGFFDYLSLLAIQQKENIPLTNFLVLNSLSLFERARPEMEKHSFVNLFLDRDPAGIKITEQAMILSNKYIDRSSLFQHHKDVNDWLINKSQALKNTQKIRRHS